jgi:N-acetylglucosamine-6-sulfatase
VLRLNSRATPQIDSLAREGVRFEHAFCTTSLCSPSRASILTGLYAHRHGVRDNFTELPSRCRTGPAVCARADTPLHT